MFFQIDSPCLIKSPASYSLCPGFLILFVLQTGLKHTDGDSTTSTNCHNHKNSANKTNNLSTLPVVHFCSTIQLKKLVFELQVVFLEDCFSRINYILFTPILPQNHYLVSLQHFCTMASYLSMLLDIKCRLLRCVQMGAIIKLPCLDIYQTSDQIITHLTLEIIWKGIRRAKVGDKEQQL